MKFLISTGEPGTSVPGVFSTLVLRALTLTARLIVLIGLTLNATAGPVTNFDDILYWVGSGANQSALAIDWDGQSSADNSLVWGYRWDGTAKGVDMLTAIVVADDRLYAKMGPISGFGFAVVGIGYDANNDGLFALDDDTSFDEHGISGDVPSDGAMSVDPADWYAEGWFVTSFWNYGVATSSPFDGGTWVRSGSGISSRNLANGSWDSLAITPINTQTYAQNPIAAEPSGDADFDADGDVDGRDFLAWQRGYGLVATATHGDGDANGDGNVDATDLSFWSEQYGTHNLYQAFKDPSPSPSPEYRGGGLGYGTFTLSSFTSDALEGVTLVVPEPSTLFCLCLAGGAWSVGFTRFRFASRRMNS
jgi:hypothetical protein